jgi:hypothetical protein
MPVATSVDTLETVEWLVTALDRQLRSLRVLPPQIHGDIIEDCNSTVKVILDLLHSGR